MQDTRTWRFILAAGIAGLVVFVGAVLAYGRAPAFLGMVVTVPLLSWAAARRWLAASALLLILGGVFWAAFGTVAGFFWLNRGRLDALVAEIEAVPAITSIELGHDAPLPAGMGRTGRYDSYRFINGRLVTQYRDQVAPTAFQPVFLETDVLRELGVSPARHAALRASLEGLRLAGFHRGQDGEIALNEAVPGGAPWGTAFLFRPADGPPSARNVQEWHRLAPRWFHVWSG